jgi:hypothetical protein
VIQVDWIDVVVKPLQTQQAVVFETVPEQETAAVVLVATVAG